MLRASLHRFAEADGTHGAEAPPDSSADGTSLDPPPLIPPAAAGPRPFWSVMIPIYNAREDYLRETLQSVLCQAPGTEEMQIEVLDNCSTVGDPEALVREIGGGRVGFHRQTHNLGIAGNFNACIERARGHWVHILHGDDTVRPDFYRRARSGIEAHGEVAAALCRIIYMDEDGQWMGLTDLESRQRGVLDAGFVWRQLLDQRIQFVGMVVARSTYEEVGGFRPSLPSCMDWDMWKRIALRKPIHYEPEPLACYRLHEAAESSRLIMTAGNVIEERRSIAYTCASLPAGQAMLARRAAAKAAGVRAARRARILWKRGMRGAAWRQCAAAVRCSLTPAVLARTAFFVLFAIMDRSRSA